MNVQFDKWEESALRQKLVQRADEKAGYIHYWFDEKFLTQDWFEQRLIEAVKDAGPRYTADLNFELPIAGVFDALGRTDEFLRQFHAFYSELYRRWNRAKSWGLLGQTLPEVAAAVDGLCQKVEDIGKALDRSAVEPFEPIDLEALGGLSRALSEELHSCFESIDQFDRQHEGDPQQLTSGSYDPTPAALASAARHALRQLDDCVSEIIEFTNGEAARISNHSFILVLGEAGIGKTHLFCDVAKHRLGSGLPTILLLGEKFSAEMGPWSQVTEQLLLTHLSPEEFLGVLDAAGQIRRRRALIMIDALNEGQGLDLWSKYLGGMTETAKKYPHIAFALSPPGYVSAGGHTARHGRERGTSNGPPPGFPRI